MKLIIVTDTQENEIKKMRGSKINPENKLEKKRSYKINL